MEVAITHRTTKMVFDEVDDIGVVVTMQSLGSESQKQVDVFVSVYIGHSTPLSRVDACGQLNGMKGPEYAIAHASLFEFLNLRGALG